MSAAPQKSDTATLLLKEACAKSGLTSEIIRWLIKHGVVKGEILRPRRKTFVYADSLQTHMEVTSKDPQFWKHWLKAKRKDRP